MIADVPVPERMRALDRDPRGYPIPVIVQRDRHGRAHFTINNEVDRQRVILEDRCSICGGKLTRGRWFAGGPASAFHPCGVYIDPAMHHECMTYAMLVCPYLATPRYAKALDGRTLDHDDAMRLGIVVDHNATLDRPAVFVAVMATRVRLLMGEIVGNGRAVEFVQYLDPVRPYVRIEFWRHGVKVGERQDRKKALVDRAWPKR